VNKPQPGETLNTRYVIGKTMTMNKDEVKEDPSEDEIIDAFKSKGIKAFEVKGTEAFEEEGIEDFPSEDNYQAKT